MTDRLAAIGVGAIAGAAVWFALAVALYVIDQPFDWRAHVLAALFGAVTASRTWPTRSLS